MINVGIIGSTGYSGTELIRILSNHPEVNISILVSKNFEGKNISDVYPHFTNLIDIDCSILDTLEISQKCDLVFTALPHGISLEIVAELINYGLKVIDLSGDYRYKSSDIYKEWYKINHTHKDLLSTAVYGLSELNRDKIKKGNLIANPGCYPTCSVLSLAPLVSANIIDIHSIIINAVSGVSGAGRTSSLPFQFTECTENFRAYKVASHRHTSEIEQELSLLANKPVVVTFTPHLSPIKRGILVTAYASLTKKVSSCDLYELYNEYYKNQFFIRIRPEGVHPQTKWVAGSNFVDIGITLDSRTNRVVIVGAMDNLMKGAAGQAVQNMNIMCGFDETTALNLSGFYI